MRKTLLAGAAAFVLTAAPSVLFAQDATDPNPPQGATAPVPAPDGTTTVTTTQTTTSSTPQAAKGTEAGRKMTMTTQQKTVYATWPAQRRIDYEALAGEDQTYYWTLTPIQQEGYWALTPDQRGQIYKMTPEQRAAAWQSIEQQLAGQTPTTPAGQANPPGEACLPPAYLTRRAPTKPRNRRCQRTKAIRAGPTRAPTRHRQLTPWARIIPSAAGR